MKSIDFNGYLSIGLQSISDSSSVASSFMMTGRRPSLQLTMATPGFSFHSASAKAAGYLERARAALFSYVRRWLLLGIACPRVSSFIERTMRELGRRIKKLAYNWKETGLNKISSILLRLCVRLHTFRVCPH